MRIKRIESQHRRDFFAVYECEHCGNEERGSGYDDAFFHETVIPAMKCSQCDKTAADGYRPLKPKYAEGEVV